MLLGAFRNVVLSFFFIHPKMFDLEGHPQYQMFDPQFLKITGNEIK